MYNINKDTTASIGISSVILLVAILLIAATVGSVITETSQEVSEEDINILVEDAVKEITSYIQIKNILGKYYAFENTYTLQKIMILITPLFHVDYDLSTLVIQLQTKDMVTNLYYTQQAVVPKGDLFADSNWNQEKENVFNCLISLDTDDSVKQYNILNDPTDMVYLTIDLPQSMYLYKGDSMKISLIAGTGILRSISIKAPVPINKIVQL